jgi:hypothetical protein
VYDFSDESDGVCQKLNLSQISEKNQRSTRRRKKDCAKENLTPIQSKSSLQHTLQMSIDSGVFMSPASLLSLDANTVTSTPNAPLLSAPHHVKDTKDELPGFSSLLLSPVEKVDVTNVQEKLSNSPVPLYNDLETSENENATVASKHDFMIMFIFLSTIL